MRPRHIFSARADISSAECRGNSSGVRIAGRTLGVKTHFNRQPDMENNGLRLLLMLEKFGE